MKGSVEWLVGIAVVGTLVTVPCAAAAESACPARDVRTMLAEAGQGMNGRVIARHETHITIVAESRYNDTIKFDETVRVYGKRLPAVVQGRIGIVVRRDGDRWTAGRCDVVPGWRMANALSGRQPCPKPRVRISRVRVDGLVAHVTLRLSGDVTALRLDSGQTVRRRRFAQPGIQMIVEDFTYSRAGRFRAKIRAEGGFGPGCGTARRHISTARKTIVIR
jgi:hypothetical protein